jgi:hypothetical protein
MRSLVWRSGREVRVSVVACLPVERVVRELVYDLKEEPERAAILSAPVRNSELDVRHRRLRGAVPDAFSLEAVNGSRQQGHSQPQPHGHKVEIGLEVIGLEHYAGRPWTSRDNRRRSHRHTSYDRQSGAPINSNLVDYVVAVNADVPPIDVHFVDFPDKETNALGARGIGEIGLAGIAAAITAAVHHATGVRVRELPVKIEQLLG